MAQSDLATRFTVRDSRGDGAALVLRLLDSHLNYASADDLKTRLKEVVSENLSRGRRRFVMDLTDVAVMDSCGLAVLISLKKLVDGQGGELALAGMCGMIRRLFSLTKLDQAFEIRESADEALEGER